MSNRNLSPSVHPRACGERSRSWTMQAISSGSSPRLRGTVGWERVTVQDPRFIPAPAGNGLGSSFPLDSCGLAGSSPRLRGTACGRLDSWVRLVSGSSPRLRGTAAPASQNWHRPDGHAVHPRACGERATGGNSTQSTLHPVHPRACGERASAHLGKSIARYVRFIPAPAGNGLSRAEPDTEIASGSSPRLRGTGFVSLTSSFSSTIRFIPAPAGNGCTGQRTVVQSALSVHPRACGERPLTGRESANSNAQRFIPAPAGNGILRSSWEKYRQTRFIPAPAGNGDFARAEPVSQK